MTHRAMTHRTNPSRSRWLGPEPRTPARRVASLVPSLTLALFDLGAGATVVGRTAYCVEPRGRVEGIAAVGGTKNVDVARVLALRPDVVLANREENTRERVEAVARQVPVWLSDPRGPEDVPALWRELGAICGRRAEAERRAREVEAALPAAAAADQRSGEPAPGERAGSGDAGGGAGPGFLYWVWREPWMAAGRDTYISRVLEAAGWRNVAPEGRGRYPRLSPGEALALAPRAMLFASEPYAFELPDELEAFGLEPTPEGAAWRLEDGPLALAVDGRLFGWYPSLTAAALTRARQLRRTLGGP